VGRETSCRTDVGLVQPLEEGIDIGYTHYWNLKEPVEQQVWDRLVENVHGLLSVAVARGFKIAGPVGDDEIVLDGDKIGFNGVGEDGYESFILERDPKIPEWRRNRADMERFAVCKTGRRPYDPVVTAALCLAEEITGGLFRVSSDGNPSDWEEGRDLAKEILKEADIPKGVLDPDCRPTLGR
jgi:hypothetical protein